MIYLDHAATSWPKPACVHEAMERFMRDVGASAGRSAHRLSLEAERIRFDAREVIGCLLGLNDPMRVIFTPNATTALNMVIHGLLTRENSHVVTTGMEHNAVMRPLRALEQSGVTVSIVPCQSDGMMHATSIEERIKPNTRLIVVNHASNVCGTVLPVRQIGEIARRHGIPLLVDAAQTAGAWPIDMHADHIDLLVFTGHKGLLGPSGTGGLAIHDDFNLDLLPPFIHGGTGSQSEEETQPNLMPDKYEAGTPNSVGLAGLAASVHYLMDYGLEQIVAQEQKLTSRLIDGLDEIDGVHVIGPMELNQRTAVVSFNIESIPCSEVAHHLDQQFDIMCRPGLHCAPRTHRTLGTYPDGTVRFAPGPFVPIEEVDRAIEAVTTLAEQRLNV